MVCTKARGWADFPWFLANSAMPAAALPQDASGAARAGGASISPSAGGPLQQEQRCPVSRTGGAVQLFCFLMASLSAEFLQSLGALDVGRVAQCWPPTLPAWLPAWQSMFRSLLHGWAAARSAGLPDPDPSTAPLVCWACGNSTGTGDGWVSLERGFQLQKSLSTAIDALSVLGSSIRCILWHVHLLLELPLKNTSCAVFWQYHPRTSSHTKPTRNTWRDVPAC